MRPQVTKLKPSSSSEPAVPAGETSSISLISPFFWSVNTVVRKHLVRQKEPYLQSVWKADCQTGQYVAQLSRLLPVATDTR